MKVCVYFVPYQDTKKQWAQVSEDGGGLRGFQFPNHINVRTVPGG